MNRSEATSMATIDGFPGYTISEDGTVTGPRGKQLSPEETHNGYLRIWLYDGAGNRKRRRVHVLVAEAFIGQRPFDGAEIRHLDGDRKNCRVDNLSWGTKKENAADRIEHGTQVSGEKHPKAKLTDDQVQQLITMRQAGATTTFLGMIFGITRQHAGRLCRELRTPIRYRKAAC